MSAIAAKAAPRPVLAFTDLSDAAGHALREAEIWCRRTGASLVVGHAIPTTAGAIAPLLPHSRSVVPPASEFEAARDAVHRQVQACTGRTPLGYALIIERAETVALAKSIAEELDAQLLLIGDTPGTASGRAAVALATSSRVPVFVVRSAIEGGIVVAAGKVRDTPSRARAWGAHIADHTGEVLTIVHDIDPVSLARERDASIIVIDADSLHDDPQDIVQRATCSVLIIRGSDATRPSGRTEH